MPVGATDWLRSLGEESDTDKDRPDIAEEPIAEDMPEQGIPDWLRNVSPDELARDIAAAEPERSAYDQQQNADLPPDSVQSADWLVDSATALSAMAQSLDLDALAEPALPDWLRDVSPDELERDIASVQSEPSPVSPDLHPDYPTGCAIYPQEKTSVIQVSQTVLPGLMIAMRDLHNYQTGW